LRTRAFTIKNIIRNRTTEVRNKVRDIINMDLRKIRDRSATPVKIRKRIKAMTEILRCIDFGTNSYLLLKSIYQSHKAVK